MGARTSVIFLTALLAGCTASVRGEPLGQKFGTAYATASRGSSSIESHYTINIANSSDEECGGPSVAVPPDGTQLMRVNIVRNGTELPVARGEPYLETGAEAWVNVFGCVVTGGLCRLATLGGAKLTLTGASDAKVSGNFTANGFSGAEFSVNFDAPLCQL